MKKILIGISAVIGLFSLFIETRPIWDDTGILVVGIFLACGLLALIEYQRPWLLALVIGIWFPLYRITVEHPVGFSPGWFIIGDESSILHKPTIIHLP